MGQARIPLQVIASDVPNKVPYVFSTKETPEVPMSLACRASAAVPFLYSPVTHEGVFLADGGLVCNIPVDRLVQDDAIRLGIDVEDTNETPTSPLWQYALSLLKLSLISNENTEVHLGEALGAKVIKVPTQASPFDTRLTRAQKQELFNLGYDYTAAYLNTLK
jgi:NTE family protein